jgi:hypothetical protein
MALWLLPVSSESLRSWAASDGWSVIVRRGFFAGMVHHKPGRCITAMGYASLFCHGASNQFWLSKAPPRDQRQLVGGGKVKLCQVVGRWHGGAGALVML